MSHPLTNRKCGDIAENLPDYNAETCMRAAADWQLEQVIDWLRTQTDYSGTFYYETLGDIETIEDALMNAMRPQEDN